MHINLDSSDPLPAGCIFVVETDEVIRSALRFILEHHWTVHAFAGLDPALERAADLTPAVVVLGIGLLQSNGARVPADLVALLPETKILLVANSARDPLALTGLAWGAHEVLGKPFTFDTVHHKVEALLASHQASPTAPEPAQSAIC